MYNYFINDKPEELAWNYFEILGINELEENINSNWIFNIR